MNKTIVTILGFLVLTGISQEARAQDHFIFPIEAGNEKWFHQVENPDKELHWWFPGETLNDAFIRYSEIIDTGVVVSESCDLYTVDSEGDVFSHGLCADFQDPELVMDAPFWVGKSWEYCLSGSCFEMVVVRQETITVPFGGPYPCFVAEIRSGSGAEVISTNWVNDGVGFVKMETLAGTWVLSGGVVPAENMTWGGVKSLYRQE